MKIEIPEKDKSLYQANRGEVSGTVWATWSLDLDSNKPKIRVSPRLIVHSSSNDDSDLIYPIAFCRNLSGSGSVDTYFAICSQAIFQIPVANLGSTVFTQDNLSNSPTTALSRLYSDACNVGASMVVSLKTDVALLSGGIWTAAFWTGLGGVALTDSTPHPVCTGFTKETLIGNGNKIASITYPATINNARLTLDAVYEVMWIRSGSFAYWIGCRHKFGGEGKVFKWDGASEYVVGEYGIEGANLPFSCVIKNEIPYIVTSNGLLLEFTGGGFSEIARFPVANSKLDVLNDDVTEGVAASLGYPINVNRNGMAIIDNEIHILINAMITRNNDSSNVSVLENMLSGIWCYTKTEGLYHRYGISKGTSVSTVVDYGSPKLQQSGALFPLNKINKFLAGAQLLKDSSLTNTSIGVINWISADAIPKMGYFITPQIYSKDLDEAWQKSFLQFKKLVNTGDSITLKYRKLTNFRGLYTSPGTWTSTTGFTTPADITNVSIGDEIEILTGEGSGLSAKITAVTPGSPSSLTIDTAVTGASGTFEFRVANWTTIDSQTALTDVYKEFSLGQYSIAMQFKALMYGTGSAAIDYADSPEVEKLLILSSVQIPAKA